MTRHFARLSLAGLMVAGFAHALASQSPPASAAPPNGPAGRGPSADRIARPTIVLVHGAFADGSAWHRVIPLLQRDGYNVIAVQNPLTSFGTDVETTRRVIEAQLGPVIAVGHSYGGAVITEAAAGSPRVKALVYVAAFAPEVGEPIGAFLEKYPSALGPALKPDAAGFLYIDRARFHQVFAKDVPAAEARVAAAAQKPIIGSAFSATVSKAAWKTIPSWYVLTLEDQAINPGLQRFYAERMGAKTVDVKTSHVPFVSQPAAVVRIIQQAAGAAVQPTASSTAK
jgi:pimeloyl-ACP methyl ester carboxylesterase